MNLRLVRCEAGDSSHKTAYDTGFKYTVDRLYEERPLLRSAKNQVARDAEARFSLGDCLYFYAGYACPRFGDIVFVFDPSITRNVQGNAGDFDSGGLFLARIQFARPVNDVVAWARNHVCNLVDWQQRCTAHVTQYWQGSWERFVRGERADTDDAEGRLLHADNWREAWMFEVRLHDDHPIAKGLCQIALRPEAVASIMDQTLFDRDASRAERWRQREAQQLVRGYPVDLHGSVQDAIATGTL